jgi:hypothetical protein
VPISFADYTEEGANFEAAQLGLNSEGWLRITEADGGSSDFEFRLDPDFNQEIVIYTFVTYGDIISYLGGLKSAVGPVFEITTPLAILYFLFMLSAIIQQSYTLQYRDQLEQSVEVLHQALPIGDQSQFDI